MCLSLGSPEEDSKQGFVVKSSVKEVLPSRNWEARWTCWIRNGRSPAKVQILSQAIKYKICLRVCPTPGKETGLHAHVLEGDGVRPALERM